MTIKVVDSRTFHEETDSEFLMIMAFLDPKDGFGGVSSSRCGAPIIHDKTGNTGELHAEDYHLETAN